MIEARNKLRKLINGIIKQSSCLSGLNGTSKIFFIIIISLFQTASTLSQWEKQIVRVKFRGRLHQFFFHTNFFVICFNSIIQFQFFVCSLQITGSLGQCYRVKLSVYMYILVFQWNISHWQEASIESFILYSFFNHVLFRMEQMWIPGMEWEILHYTVPLSLVEL